MDAEAYLKSRVENQIEWYDRKSVHAQRWFRGLSIAQVICGASIPVLASHTATSASVRIFVGALGAIVAVIAGSLGLLKFQEHWIEYRTTCESLKKEKFLFVTHVEPYTGETAFSLLVQRVETLVSKENTNWAQYMMKPASGDQHGH